MSIDKNQINKIDGLNIIQRFDNTIKYLKEDFIQPKSQHKLEGCIHKTFNYLSNVSAEDFTIEFEINNKTKIYKFEAPKVIRVSSYILRRYSCLEYGCSKCCWYVGFHNIFSKNEYNQLVNLYNEDIYDVKEIKLNDKKYILYTLDHTKTKCNHLDENINGCKIHILNPIHCAFPLLKLDRNKNGRVNIIRKAFGRNTRFMKCPVEFESYCDKNTYDYTILLFERLKKMGEEFNVKTRVDEIIDKIIYMYEHQDKISVCHDETYF